MCKPYLLTDLNVYFKDYKVINTFNCLQDVKDRIHNMGNIYGEIYDGSIDNFEISFKNIILSINNITFINNKIYGDVIFLKEFKDSFNELKIIPKFRIRANGIYDEDNMVIRLHKIFTWDLIA